MKKKLIIIFIATISLFLIVTFLGKNKNNISIDAISLITLYKTRPHIVTIIPYFKRYGVIRIVIIILTICSNRFDIVWGNILSFPKKYPLAIHDKVINGSVKLINSIG